MVLEYISMTNPIKKAFFFILYFTLFTGLSLFLFYTFQDSPFKRKMLRLDLTHVASLCPESPKKELYQECLRSEIAPLSKMATPLELIKVPTLLDSYHNQDKIQGDQYLESAHIAFIINQVIFYESLAHFAIRRDSIDFFQILMLPYFRWHLGQELKRTKEEMKPFLEKDLNQQSLSTIEKRYLSKFNKLNILAL